MAFTYQGERLTGAAVIGALTACSLVMLSLVAPEVQLPGYRSIFLWIVVIVGALSIAVLLLYREGGRRFVFAPKLWNWVLLGASSSALCGVLSWLLAQGSGHALALAHLPTAIGVFVLLMYRLEASSYMDQVQIREITEEEWNASGSS